MVAFRRHANYRTAMKYKILLIVAAVVVVVDSAKILGLFPTDTSSHYMVYSRLMAALAERGHSVTVVSHFPKDEKPDNFRDVGLNGSLIIPYMSVDELLAMSHVDNEFDVINMCLQACEAVLKHPTLLKIMEEDDFDLFITEIFATECFLAVGHKLKIPMIGIVTSVTLPWTNDMLGNPDNPSYIPLYFLPLSHNMNIFERTYNAVMNLVMKAYYEVYSLIPSQKIAESSFGSLPSLKEIAKNYSLILVNSHFSLNQVRPMVPQSIEVGGLHIPKVVDKLPQDLQTFLDESKNGVIYFSLGSIVPVETFSEEKLKDIIEVFSNLKENVLWKINGTLLPKVSKNVKTSDWVPQLAVLCHPSTKLFIGHGGMLGMQEAIHCGVPMLGMPMFADQGHNVAEAKEKGFGLVLSYKNLNKHTFSESLNALLNDKSYSEKAKEISEIFRDRPMHPMDTAIYWIEYVFKFRGAHHLKSPSLDLKWYQHILLDVTLVVCLAVFTTIIIIAYICKRLSVFLNLITHKLLKRNKSEREKNNNVRLKKE